MQQFHKFITWRLCVNQHVSAPIVGRGLTGYPANNAPTATLQRWNQRLLAQFYAPDDGRRGARNMLSHK